MCIRPIPDDVEGFYPAALVRATERRLRAIVVVALLLGIASGALGVVLLVRATCGAV